MKKLVIFFVIVLSLLLLIIYSVKNRIALLVLNIISIIISLISLGISIWILTGCGVSGGCEMIGLLFYISSPVFILSTVSTILITIKLHKLKILKIKSQVGNGNPVV